MLVLEVKLPKKIGHLAFQVLFSFLVVTLILFFLGVHTNQQKTSPSHTPIIIWISSPFPPWVFRRTLPPPRKFRPTKRVDKTHGFFGLWSGEEGGTRRGPPTATKSGFLSCRPSFFFEGWRKTQLTTDLLLK